MRKLSAKSKALAADKLGMAYSHLRVAESMIQQEEYNASIRELYYAGYFAAQAALADLESKSKKHNFWIGNFNRRHSRGRSWIPSAYPKLLNQLAQLRDEYDYQGTLFVEYEQAISYQRRVDNLLKKVISNTPLLRYPELIKRIIDFHFYLKTLEFDYYCPKAYIHKERIQVQVQAMYFNEAYYKRIFRAVKKTAKLLDVSRQEDYVLGWNNRLGQNADAYLLFLDIDDNDEIRVRNALKDRNGWIFKSGEGFHFIGAEIYYSQKQWEYRFKQAAKSKKLKGLIDQDHVSFSLKRGYSTLRMTTSEVKQFEPFMFIDNAILRGF